MKNANRVQKTLWRLQNLQYIHISAALKHGRHNKIGQTKFVSNQKNLTNLLNKGEQLYKTQMGKFIN